jgi:transcriptional regulator with XRE-family HTH domain
MTVNLKVARAICGLSQLELGLKVGVSASTVSLIERGFRRVTKVEREALAGALGMPIESIDFDRAGYRLGNADSTNALL